MIYKNKLKQKNKNLLRRIKKVMKAALTPPQAE